MKKGVTLIELLMVVAIIGILAAAAMFSFASARVKARDAKRIADVKLIQTSLELYAVEQNKAGNYPYPQRLYGSELQPYLPDVPTDPLGKTEYQYYAPACLITQNKPNTTTIVAAVTTGGRKLLGTSSVTKSNCPQGGWLPYAILTKFEKPKTTGNNSNQFISLVPGDTSVAVYSNKQAITPR